MNRSDEVYATLKSQILDWTRPPGAPLPEPEITQSLGASRTPVREALLQLSRDGLVRLVKGRGAFVTDISMADVTELFQMREALESYGAKLAAMSQRRQVISDFLPRFSGFLEKFEEPLIPEPYDEAKRDYYALSSELDDAITDLAGNARLAASLRQVWSEVQRSRRVAASRPERLLESIPEHIGIVEAIVAGDPDAAAVATATHIRRSLQHVRENLLNGDLGSEFVKITGR